MTRSGRPSPLRSPTAIAAVAPDPRLTALSSAKLGVPDVTVFRYSWLGPDALPTIRSSVPSPLTSLSASAVVAGLPVPIAVPAAKPCQVPDALVPWLRYSSGGAPSAPMITSGRPSPLTSPTAIAVSSTPLPPPATRSTG